MSSISDPLGDRRQGANEHEGGAEQAGGHSDQLNAQGRALVARESASGFRFNLIDPGAAMGPEGT
ncbi:MAG TPA: hypothetical protein D7I05_02195 [Candidatus Poseidoniales archaeon]|nr:MAG TPA: hypothetical protein D7I05_02195 [Candidatus Poseidoniales archaeon]